jgi:hypothetical protein
MLNLRNIGKNQVIELKKEIEEFNRRISSLEVDIFYENEFKKEE